MVVEINNNAVFQLYKIASQLKEEQLGETLNFAKFLLLKNENKKNLRDVSVANLQSESFNFLKSEPDLYDENDILPTK